jgi:hypothetical protein
VASGRGWVLWRVVQLVMQMDDSRGAQGRAAAAFVYMCMSVVLYL